MTDNALLPRHVAVIMDGNGRWAQKNKVSRLAGHNAGRAARGETLITLPESTAIGSLLTYEKPDGGMITFAGDEFFAHMKETGLYTTDIEKIADRIETAGLTGIYNAFN